MQDDGPSPSSGPAVTDRRALLLGAAAVTAGAWVAPSITSAPAASAATCFAVAPELVIGGAAVSTAAPSGASELVRDDTNAAIWFESGPTALASPLAVDATTNGSWALNNTNGSATIASGTEVFSYYVHFRPTSGGGSRYNTGSITIPAGYSFGGIAFNAAGAAPVSPTPCAGGSGTLRTTTGLGAPTVDYAYCRLIGHGYEPTPYTDNLPANPPPPDWALLPTPVVRDTVVVSGGPGPGTPTVVTWYCFTGATNSDDFRLFVIPQAC